MSPDDDDGVSLSVRRQATKRQLREIAQEVLVRIRHDIMSAEAKRMKWQQGSEQAEIASTIAKVDEAVRDHMHVPVCCGC